MKIAYVLKKFPRYSETFILREILGLEAAGVAVQVFSMNPPRDGRFHASLARLAHTVEYLPESGNKKAWAGALPHLPRSAGSREEAARLFWECADRGRPELFKYLLSAIHLAPRLRESGITHVHAHFATSASEVARMAARLSGLPMSFTTHAKDIYSDDIDDDGLRRKFEDCRFAVTVCDANADYLRARYPAAEGKLVRIYNGIDLTRWEADEGEIPPASAEPPVVLAVGRFVEKKGFPLFLRALAKLRERGVAVTGRLVGDGEDQQALHALREELGLGGVLDLPGSASSEQIREEMKRATVLACPSIQAANGDRDALPTVLVEALAAGLPVVTTRVGGISEIVDHGRAGFEIEENADSLADGLERLLGDASLRERYIQAGRIRARELFDLDKNAGILAGYFAGGSPQGAEPHPAEARS